MDPGDLAFDYGGRTMRFGKWLRHEDGVAAAAALAEALSAERKRRSQHSRATRESCRHTRHKVVEHEAGVRFACLSAIHPSLAAPF